VIKQYKKQAYLQYLNNTFELPIGKLTTGVYFIVVQNVEKTLYARLIKVE
jgi:hypothetical protein